MTAIVVDFGPKINAGYAGEDYPRISDFPCALGYPKYPAEHPSECVKGIWGIQERGYACGDELHTLAPYLNIVNAIEKDIIKDWDCMQKVWSHLFSSELRVESFERPLFLIESVLLAPPDREKIAEMLFGTFHVPALYFAPQSVLMSYACEHSPGAKNFHTSAPNPQDESPKFFAWIGGSILASSPHFVKYWITLQEYKAEGAKIILRCADLLPEALQAC